MPFHITVNHLANGNGTGAVSSFISTINYKISRQHKLKH